MEMNLSIMYVSPEIFLDADERVDHAACLCSLDSTRKIVSNEIVEQGQITLILLSEFVGPLLTPLATGLPRFRMTLVRW